MQSSEPAEPENAFQIHIEKTTNVVLGIDLEQYRPIDSLSHYGRIILSHTGTYTSTPPLPPHIANFIRDLHSDLSLWDGTSGTFGRDYLTHRPLSTRITSQQVDDYRMQYMQLIADTTPRAILEQLRRTIEKQSRIQSQLRQAVQDVQRRMDKLRRQRDRLEIDEGPSSERVQDIDDRLVYDNDELATLRTAQKQIQQRLLQTELELSERETGHVRRIALLRRIFGEEPLRGGLLLPYTTNAEVKASFVNKCDQIAMRTSRLLLDAKCFYLDAVVAKTYLYKLESTLKSILENLHQAVDALNPPLSNKNSSPSFLMRTFSNSMSPSLHKNKSHHHGDTDNHADDVKVKADEQPNDALLQGRLGERGPDFRIRYVRKLWNSLEADYKATLRYISATSLQIAAAKVRTMNNVTGADTSNNSNGEGDAMKQEGSKPFLHIAVSKRLSSHKSTHEDEIKKQASGKALPGQRSATDKYGTFGVFHHGAPLLPRFSSIELSHALNKRARLSAMHKCAAKVYREVNVVYDVHEDLVQKALVLLQKRMTEDRKANEQLISKWEELLGVDTT